MNRILIFLHGMGRHDDGWHAGPLDVLRDAATGYGVGARFDEWVEPHGIVYDDVFRGLTARWARSTTELRAAMEADGIGSPRVAGWLERLEPSEDEWFWSHAVDVLLYRFFPRVAAPVRARVLEQLVRVLNHAMADGPSPRVMLVAHGLGTAVARDALAHLTTTRIDGSGAYLSARGWRLDHLVMVANVSRALDDLPVPFYRSTVRPEGTPGHDGNAPALEEYIDIRHRLDPIPAVRPFDPPDWGDRYVPVHGLDHVLDWDVHALEHYLRHPDAHVPILNRLLDFPIDDDARAAATAALPSAPRPECIEAVARLRSRLRALGEDDLGAASPDGVRGAAPSGGRPEGPEPEAALEAEALLEVVVRLHTLVEEARGACSDLLAIDGGAT